MNPAIIIGGNIKIIREQQGIKIEALGKALNLGKSRMSQIENGDCKELTLNRIGKIAAFLNVDFFQIVSLPSQTVNINNNENSSGFNTKPYSFSQEAIISIVDELLGRMQQRQ